MITEQTLNTSSVVTPTSLETVTVPPTDSPADLVQRDTFKSPWSAQTPAPESLPITDIVVDENLQCRTKKNQAAINEYSGRFREHVALPPVVIFRDSHGTNLLADGFHRVCGAVQAKLTALQADVYQGSWHDALIYAAGANAGHGVRRSRMDVECTIRKLLADPDCWTWTDRRLASCAVCDHKTIKRVRDELSHSGEIPTSSSRIGKDGRKIQVNVPATLEAAVPTDVPTAPKEKNGETPVVGESVSTLQGRATAKLKWAQLDELIEDIDGFDAETVWASLDQGRRITLANRLTRLADRCRNALKTGGEA